MNSDAAPAPTAHKMSSARGHSETSNLNNAAGAGNPPNDPKPFKDPKDPNNFKLHWAAIEFCRVRKYPAAANHIDTKARRKSYARTKLDDDGHESGYEADRDDGVRKTRSKHGALEVEDLEMRDLEIEVSEEREEKRGVKRHRTSTSLGRLESVRICT